MLRARERCFFASLTAENDNDLLSGQGGLNLIKLLLPLSRTLTGMWLFLLQSEKCLKWNSNLKRCFILQIYLLLLYSTVL